MSQLVDGLTGLWQASVEARRALSAGSPVAALDRILQAEERKAGA